MADVAVSSNVSLALAASEPAHTPAGPWRRSTTPSSRLCLSSVRMWHPLIHLLSVTLQQMSTTSSSSSRVDTAHRSTASTPHSSTMPHRHSSSSTRSRHSRSTHPHPRLSPSSLRSVAVVSPSIQENHNKDDYNVTSSLWRSRPWLTRGWGARRWLLARSTRRASPTRWGWGRC